jgi:hypothetical protein
MCRREYVVGTGYYHIPDKSSKFFNEYWYPNTLKYFDPKKIVVVNAGAEPPLYSDILEYINFTRNPGHGALINKYNNTRLSGWSSGFVMGALYAYFCNCDFIYKEQDALTFGNIVERIYDSKKKTGASIITGNLIDHPYIYEQSLIYLEYDFILDFIFQYIKIPNPEHNSDKGLRMEKKFKIVEKKDPSKFGMFDFGYGGVRPFNPDDDCFWIQKPRWIWKEKTPIKTEVGSLIPNDELDCLKEKGLI